VDHRIELALADGHLQLVVSDGIGDVSLTDDVPTETVRRAIIAS